MTAISQALSRLRSTPAADRAGVREHGALTAGLDGAAVGFAAVGGPLEQRWDQALSELGRCVSPFAGASPTLSEGGVYHGAWVESTGTISTEVLGRFAPAVTTATHRLFADHQRPDGLMPYKVTADGPAFTQIQLVSPLARAVWNHYRAGHGDRDYLRTMYDAMARMDGWLVRHRNTRGTGGVEAFCTFDTGHDLSPRFWHVPDRCHQGDAAQWDPDVPGLPFVAPDLTAWAVSQRQHLALMAQELGEDPTPWHAGAQSAERALWEQCWDPADQIFYDRDATDGHVRVGSDVLLRVFACGVGDADVFTLALEKHLMHTGRFLGGYGLTSIAMDDPRFDQDYTRNSWAGPSNFLTAIRAPYAFENHGRVAELGLITMPLLEALAVADRFPQCVDPWTGTAGFTEVYSPAILWFMDALERYAGVLAQPDGEVWLSALPPTRIGHGAAPAATAYARTIHGVHYEIACDDRHAEVWRDGERWATMPRGWRLVLDATGAPAAVVGLVAGRMTGTLAVGSAEFELTVGPNDRVDLASAATISPGYVPPRS